MKIIQVCLLMLLAFQASAQVTTFYDSRTGQWIRIPATAEGLRQYQIQKQQEQIQDEIYVFNRDILEKSNALQKLLTPNYNGWTMPCQRTNIAERLEQMATSKKQLPVDPWRIIDGEVVFIGSDSRLSGFTGKIIQTTSDGILIQSYSDINMATVFVKNFPYTYADGSEISLIAVKTDPYVYDSLTGEHKVEAFDYGKPCERPANADAVEAEYFKIKPAQTLAITNDAVAALAEIKKAQNDLDVSRQNLSDFYQKLNDQRQAVIDKNNAVLKSQQDEKQAAKDKVLKYNQDLADSGDAYGLLRMGERYRDGDDVPKDSDKAREYLSKAANAGSETASNELSQLNEISSKNPP